jgi:hypothetical protein
MAAPGASGAACRLPSSPTPAWIGCGRGGSRSRGQGTRGQSLEPQRSRRRHAGRKDYELCPGEGIPVFREFAGHCAGSCRWSPLTRSDNRALVDCRKESVTAGDVGADAFVRPAEHSEAYPHGSPLTLSLRHPTSCTPQYSAGTMPRESAAASRSRLRVSGERIRNPASVPGRKGSRANRWLHDLGYFGASVVCP